MGVTQNRARWADRSREWLAASPATRCAPPQLAVGAAGVELVLQQPDRAEVGIAAKHEAHGLRLAFDRLWYCCARLAIVASENRRRHNIQAGTSSLRAVGS